jgi:hypothetical protein
MSATSPETPIRGTIWPAVGLSLIVVIGNLIGWAKTGHLAELVIALGWCGMIPAFCYTPISFTGPFRENLTRRRKPMPRWAMIFQLAGFVLAGVGLLSKLVT